MALTQQRRDPASWTHLDNSEMVQLFQNVFSHVGFDKKVIRQANGTYSDNSKLVYLFCNLYQALGLIKKVNHRVWNMDLMTTKELKKYTTINITFSWILTLLFQLINSPRCLKYQWKKNEYLVQCVNSYIELGLTIYMRGIFFEIKKFSTLE